jgi:hypothetical protein
VANYQNKLKATLEEIEIERIDCYNKVGINTETRLTWARGYPVSISVLKQVPDSIKCKLIFEGFVTFHPTAHPSRL